MIFLRFVGFENYAENSRVLDFEDILHYQKIIVALSETARLMQAIDEIELHRLIANA